MFWDWALPVGLLVAFVVVFFIILPRAGFRT
jgi:hypothetical protein